MSSFSKLSTLSTLLLLAACGADEGASTPSSAEYETAPMAQVESATPELGSFGVDLSSRDDRVKAGDDFFRYSSGLWLESFEIPADRRRYVSFDKLRDRSDERVRSIIDDLSSTEPAQGSMEQKIGDYYSSFMAVESLNELGINPIQPTLAKIDRINSVAELVQAFGNSSLDVTSSPIDFGIDADRADPDKNQLSVYVGGTSLPDRDYYLEDDERFVNIRAEYLLHIAKMLAFANISDAATKAEAILALETKIAEQMWPRAMRRDRDLTFNPMAYADFKNTYPAFDWDTYFTAVGIDELENLNVVYPSAMSPIINLVTSVSLEDWKSYLSYHLINNNSSLLSEEIYQESFNFYSTTINGVPQPRERWERAVARVGSLNSLGEAIGQLYVAQHFPDAAKQQMEMLVENLRASLGESIASLEWMGEETRAEALLKLASFRPKIAYPDEWTDLSEIQISAEDLFANARSVREFNYLDTLSRLNQPTDREEWFMTPQTVNAYYNPSFNEIVFPAAILQPPFFDPAADMAVNYGGIGAVIGHEMGHGFDDQGSKVDSLGVQRNWWSDADRSNFEQRANRLAEQYNSFEAVEGNFVDGNFTLGENIGDVGGISVAYRAYKMALNGEPAPIIDGLTGDQRFFLAFAQIWKGKIREDALISQIKSDPHSPVEFRVNGVVRNIDAWYEAFDVQPGDAMYLPPEERVRIW
ncbi:MAG: peptidase M13 [SAR86 cluster bacterium]|uniref:Peptidase M13 n=1 Tax=SAR86 cluster bacterium TaxID=2030880 RepID=A0A2A4MTL3_9GAMM|nr:MAG: peptidase M13 [SAR86 cluster bacterium]